MLIGCLQDAHKDVAAARILAAAAKRKFHCNAPDSCTAARDALARICQERATVLTPREPVSLLCLAEVLDNICASQIAVSQ